MESYDLRLSNDAVEISCAMAEQEGLVDHCSDNVEEFACSGTNALKNDTCFIDEYYEDG